MVTKAEILKNFSAASNRVFVEEFDCDLIVRRPPAETFMELAALLQPHANEDGELNEEEMSAADKVEVIRACRPVLKACVVDDEGSFVFEGKDGQALYDALSISSVMALIGGIPGDPKKK